MAFDVSKLCICLIYVLSLAMASSTNEMPADGEILFSPSSLSLYPEPPESSGYSVLSSDSSVHSSPPTPSYVDALAAEIEAEQLNLSPDYFPSPAPYFTKYHSPPPYIEGEDPEIYEKDPSPEPSSIFGSDQSADTRSAGSPDSVAMAPHPTVLPVDYRAEDESGEFDGEDHSSEQSKNRMTMMGIVLGSICLVALAAFVFNKKKEDNKPRSEDQYELTRREDV